MNGEKRGLIIGIVLIVLVLAVSFLVSFLQKENGSLELNKTTKNVTVNETEVMHQLELREAEHYLDVQAYRLANESEDGSYCELIKNETMKKECLSHNMIIVKPGQQTKRTDGDTEFYNLAVAFGNPVYCEDIRNSSLKAECDSLFPEEQEEIDSAPPTSSDQQFYKLATDFNNPTYCDNINDRELKDKCLSETN